MPHEGELAPGAVVGAIRSWLERLRARSTRRRLRRAAGAARAGPPAAGSLRLPAFCSGCPHNTSTVVPEGSLALGGIGCHGMAVWLPERRTLAVTQMGGEGANWIGAGAVHRRRRTSSRTWATAPTSTRRCSRSAPRVAANVNITYKILVNGAVAMTGGQPIEGEPTRRARSRRPRSRASSPPRACARIAVVSATTRTKYPRDRRVPAPA